MDHEDDGETSYSTFVDDVAFEPTYLQALLTAAGRNVATQLVSWWEVSTVWRLKRDHIIQICSVLSAPHCIVLIFAFLHLYINSCQFSYLKYYFCYCLWQLRRQVHGIKDAMRSYWVLRIHHYQLALLIQFTVDKPALAEGNSLSCTLCCI